MPNGITTESGLIGTITFKAKVSGKAVVSIRSDSNILLNDGLGTGTVTDLGRAEYTILPRPPDGVNIYSETHPFSGDWYNNSNPIISWDKYNGVTGFSYVLDNKPSTVPENSILTDQTTKAYENISDGLWYFHIKSYKRGVWGNTGHFLIRIDTTPPAEFTPEVNYILAAVALVERGLVSFFTTDSLSGVDHYEVGVINKSYSVTESPVFVQSESPFQVALQSSPGLHVIVRAVDRAGNVRDSSIEVQTPLLITKFLKDHLVLILVALVLIAFIALIIHYLVGHHIISHWKRIWQIAEEEEKSGKPAFPIKPPINPVITPSTTEIERNENQSNFLRN